MFLKDMFIRIFQVEYVYDSNVVCSVAVESRMFLEDTFLTFFQVNVLGTIQFENNWGI